MRLLSFVFLWLLIFIMPWEGLFAIPGLTSAARILGLLTFLLGLAGAFLSGQLRFPLALVWISLFTGWCMASIQWAADPEAAIQRAGTYLLLLTFVWLILNLVDSPQRLKAIMLAFVLGTAMTVANMYVNYIHAGVPLNTEDEVRYTAATANANGLACYCCLGILFAFYLITRRTNTGFELPNWFYWGFIVFAGVAIPLTGSRAGVLSGGVATIVLLVNCFTLIGAIEIILLGGVLGVLLVRRGKLGKLSSKARLGLAVCLLLVPVLTVRFVSRSTFSRIAEGTSGDTFRERTDAWQAGLKSWGDTPLLGVGAGCYQNALIKQGHSAMAAHNTFVSVLVESGLIGFTLYFLFWAVVFRRVLLMPKADRFFWLGVFACYLPIVLTGSMEYQKATWFLGGLAFCQGAQAHRGLH